MADNNLRLNQPDRHVRVTTAVTVQVNDLRTRADVLRWYLQINDGGTPHSPEEITRVRGLLAAATTTPGSME